MGLSFILLLLLLSLCITLLLFILFVFIFAKLLFSYRLLYAAFDSSRVKTIGIFVSANEALRFGSTINDSLKFFKRLSIRSTGYNFTVDDQGTYICIVA